MDADGGVDEVFGEFDLVVGRISEFEEMLVAWEVQEGEFIPLGGFFLLSELEADFLVESDGSGGVGDTNAGVEELDHGWEFEGKWPSCEVWSCGSGREEVEIPILKSFSWTLALRYLNPLRTFVSIITLISLLGVAFGAMVLIVVLSVHNGFERNLKDTLLGFSPHISVYSRVGDGLIYNWEEMEEELTKEEGLESAYALVEGFVLLDSKRWQRPVRFRAINTENEDQVGALRDMLDLEHYPESKVDFNLAMEESDNGGASLPPPPLGDESEAVFPPVNENKIYGDRNVVISKLLAEGIGLGPGDEIRLIAASNLDAVMAVYNVPDQRAWDLYPDVFESFEADVKRLFLAEGDEQKASTNELLKAHQLLQTLIPLEVETPDGPEESEGKEMRPVERGKVFEIWDLVAETNRTEGGFNFYEPGVKDEILAILNDLRELDLEQADNEGFRQIEKFVVPKTLIVQGVYSDNQRSQGPELFLPLSLGMELKGLKGGVESVGLRVEDPYHAEKNAKALQEKLGSDWAVQSWMVTHSQQFQLVKTEKVMMSFALSFITLLSAFSIMAVMYTVTVQKRQEIGVMKALGARPSQIVRVFVYQGLIVGVGGALLGLGMGLLAIHYREGIVTILRGFGIDPFPPEFHGMSELPALIVPAQLTVICVIAVILCLLAALVPALMAAFRDPAKSLRNL
ncbi:MAG: lipoprotein-releasing system permease protein [Granulosicoccus sp.]